jgi:hypothetical protein
MTVLLFEILFTAMTSCNLNFVFFCVYFIAFQFLRGSQGAHGWDSGKHAILTNPL